MLLSNISASSITAKTSNGKFETDLLTAADIYLKTSNGKIDAQTLLAANSIVLKTSNGAINATVVGTAEDFRIDASTSNGATTSPIPPRATKPLPSARATAIFPYSSSADENAADFLKKYG